MSKTPEQLRADRLKQRAEQMKQDADRRSEHASGLYGRFSGGQPLLVGHHSYNSALRDRARADAATRRSIKARQDAEHAEQQARKAQAVADLADLEQRRSREWCRTDFQPGDVVRVWDFRRDMAVTATYRVKRANPKTLTLDGGGGGMDDPRRTYDRVLARTRDGVTITDPAQLHTPQEPGETPCPHQNAPDDAEPDSGQTRSYHVTWTIDVEAVDPTDAARQALACQRDLRSWATVFTVTDGQEEHIVDLDPGGQGTDPDRTA